jgi:DNA-binding MarR family transcriptional regulator
MSADLQSALLDVALWLYRGFFVPGDQLLAKFPALDVAGHGRLGAGLLAAVVWLGAILSIVWVCRLIRHVDRTLTAFVVRLYEESQRAMRVAARRLSIAFRAYAVERQARSTRTEVFEQPALSGIQLAVLQSHVGLPPAHLLTPSDIARSLDMRSADVEQALATLRKLSLVARSIGAGDGEDGYRLSRAGEVFLAACGRAQRVKDDPSPQHAARPKRMEPTLGRM